MSTSRDILRGAFLGGAALLVYTRLLTPWQRHWGASAEEVQQPLPGDEAVAWPTYVATRAVTVHAAPAAVWPWLAAAARQRGPFYSLDPWQHLGVVQLAQQTTQEQALQAGQLLGPPGNAPLRVDGVDPGRLLELAPPPGSFTQGVASWTLLLQPVGALHTRLLSRTRLRLDEWSPGNALRLALADLAQFFRMRALLLAVKRQAEGSVQL